MSITLPYLDRLDGLLSDVSAGGHVLDVHWKGGDAKLKTQHKTTAVDLSKITSAHDIAAQLPTEQPNLIVIRSAWSYVLDAGLLGPLNLLVDQEIPLVVVEEVADAFSNYRGLATRYETQAKDVGHPLVYSTDIDASLRQNSFTPQTIELYTVAQEYDMLEWTQKPPSSMTDVKGRQSIKRLPKFLLDEIGIRRAQESIVYPHRWCFAVSFKSDVARHRVNAVSSALVRRKIKGAYHLLVQKRHREKAFWESWELPQGHIAPGEVFQAAAVRELREETGLQAKLCETQPFIHEWLKEKAYSAACVYTRIEQLPLKEFFAVGVVFDYVAGEPQSPEDRQFTWASLDQLKRFLDEGQIYPLNEDMVRRFVGMHLGTTYGSY